MRAVAALLICLGLGLAACNQAPAAAYSSAAPVEAMSPVTRIASGLAHVLLSHPATSSRRRARTSAWSAERAPSRPIWMSER